MPLFESVLHLIDPFLTLISNPKSWVFSLLIILPHVQMDFLCNSTKELSNKATVVALNGTGRGESESSGEILTSNQVKQ